ncbi:hypothetical protein [Streptomyces coerulescens]|uniref:Uncharacterized protein n=1 Tax=Streptomyces coerulescens TaxID=29304 RepID=A0ABW0CMY7_STRCD
MEEFAGEAVLTLVACLAALGLAVAFFWGWERNSLVTGRVGGALLAFLGYGAWELMRSKRPGRRKRLAGAAAATFAVTAVLFLYALSCNCS